MKIDNETLKTTAEETRKIRKNSGHLVQISYDQSDGTVLNAYHIDENSFKKYHDPNILTICYAARSMSEKEIAEKIEETLEMIKE